MLRSRFFWKLYGGYIVLIVMTAAVIGGIAGRRIAAESLRDAERTLRTRALLLREIAAPAFGESLAPELREKMRALGRLTATRFTVLDRQGNLLTDSEEGSAQPARDEAAPEVEAAYRGGEGLATRYSAVLNTRVMYLALPVFSRGEPVGCVRASFSLEMVDRRLYSLRRDLALGAVFTAAVALALGLFFARRVTRPLISMTEQATSMARGDYEQRVEARSRDEIGVLARALNGMAGRLHAQVETIHSECNKLLTILGGMAEGVIAVDREERVFHINEAAGSILESEAGASEGRRLWEISRLQAINDILRAVLRDGEEKTGEAVLRSRPRPQVIAIRASPLRNGSGEIAGAVIILHDVTKLRQLEAIRQDFVANVSHELKTPVTAIRAVAETLHEDDGMDPETRKRFLSRILSQTARLSTLVTDLLTLARVEAEGEVLERRPLDLRTHVREAARRAQGAAAEKGLILELDLPSEAVIVLGEDEALREIIDNLADNAVKYTPEGGRITLRAALQAGMALLEVRDTGPGIEKQHQERIFERFYRVDKARSRELGGTGLGLSIVKHCAAALGGQVSVESEPGKGSAFRVKLPLAPQGAAV
jgi:two-component system phosphate regulon sensor histidine kinase PhoR